MNLVIFDLETTGFSSKKSEIIEIGAIRVDEKLKYLEHFHEYIKPIIPVSKDITEVTGITNEILRDKRPIEKVLPEFLNFVLKKPYLLGGHNLAFDLRFITEKEKKIGKENTLATKYIDSMKLFSMLYPNQSKNLGDALAFFHLDTPNAHSALYDAKYTLQLLRRLEEVLKEKGDHIFNYIQKFEHKKA